MFQDLALRFSEGFFYWIYISSMYYHDMITIQKDISLKKYNTLRVDAQAKYFVVVKNTEEFFELLESDIWKQERSFILGSWANVLFTQDFDGIVVKNDILGKEIVREDEKHISIKVWSGESWPDFVSWCVEHNFWWIENLAFIPGTIGASAVGNIGAYGVEVKDVIEEVECVEIEKSKLKILKNPDCEFTYRESIFKQELKGKVFITSVTFKLKKFDKNYIFNLEYKDLKQMIIDKNIDPKLLTLKDIFGFIVAIRTAKLPHPEDIGTAGSFFKNPIVREEVYLGLKEHYPNLLGNNFKLSAGQLIELSWLKGYQQWHLSVSSKHALVLLNDGQWTGPELVQLADHIISEVKKNFWITLEPEVIYV